MNLYRMALVCCLLLIGCGQAVNSAEPTPTPEPYTQTLYVAPNTELCDGDTRECLLVRATIADEWELFDGTIAGFEYEAGYTYKLEVQGESAESTDWTLVEIQSQEGSFETNQPSTAEEQSQIWFLDFMLTNEIALDTDITMTFGDQKIQGSGGCNDYTADYTAEGTTTVRIDSIGATKNLCEDRISQQERDFFDALSMIAEYEQIDGSTLIFRDVQGTPVLTFVTAR